jgi:hypothetical protein
LKVLAARQRATQLQNILSHSQPGTTTEKVYMKAPKRQSKMVLEDEKENLLTQNPTVEQVPITQPTEVDERKGSFSRPLPPQLEGLYRPRNFFRQTNQQSFQDGNLKQNYGQHRIQNRPQNSPGFSESQQMSENNLVSPLSLFQPTTPYDEDRPLTIRDFERLLQLLVFRQQYNPHRINPFFPSSNSAAYPPFIPNYNHPYSQIPRPPFFNPLATGLFDPSYQNPYYSPSMPVRQQFIDLMGQQQQQHQNDQDLQRLSRRHQYNTRFFSPQQTQVPPPPITPSEQETNFNSLQGSSLENYLPSSVREQLLYRMLILALKPEQQFSYLTPSPSASSIHTVLEPEQQEANIVKNSDNFSKKPVRSVQILGEESK